MCWRLLDKLTTRSSSRRNSFSSNVEYHNPAYNDDSTISHYPETLESETRSPTVSRSNFDGDDSYNGSSSEDNIELADLEEIVNALEEMETAKKSETLDIGLLNRDKVSLN